MSILTILGCSVKINYGFILSLVLVFNFLVVTIKSSQDVSMMDVDDDTSMMDVDVDISPDDQVCTTRGCIDAAQLIRNNINESMDPCNNFFDFACGGFVSKAVVSENNPVVGHINEVREKVLIDLSNLLQEEVDPNEPRIFKLVKTYYKTCMDQNTTENSGLLALSEIVGQVGGWPLILGNLWEENTFDWVKTDIKLRQIGFPPQYIIKLRVSNDIYNTSRNLLHIAPATLELSSTILKLGVNNNNVQIFYKFMIEIAVLLGADRQRAMQELADVLMFEMQLANAMTAAHTSTIFNFTIQDLELHLPFVSWLKYLNGLTEPAAHLELSDMLYVENPSYLSQLHYIITNTSKRTLANYMIWRIVYESIPFLNNAIRDMYFQFLTAFNGKKADPAPRWKECTNLVTHKSKGMPVGVSSLYIRRFFDEETRRDVSDIVHTIGDEFKLLILELKWLDDTAKINAIRKSLFMKQIVGYPDKLVNNKMVDDYSRNLEIYPENLFKNILNVQRFHYDSSIEGLKEPIDKKAWLTFTDSTTINAYYYSIFNSFVLLAAFLQPPLFDRNWPSYVKYGSIGFIIGHETMHAYDAGRVMYDETGSWNPQFSQAHQQEYLNRIQCYINQYQQFKDDELGLSVDGTLTINENLADNVGLKVAYSAYKRWEQTHGQEEKLPGLKFTSEQVFWISSVNFLCSKDTSERRKNLLLTEEHTPDKFRALGHLLNLEEFANAFNCPKGSPMNPVQKCKLS